MIALGTLRSFHAEFPAHPDRAGAVRRAVTARLGHWRLDAIVDSAVMATNELFANAVEHGRADPGDTDTDTDTDTVTVTAECSERELRVEVADLSSAVPRPRPAGAAEESGRGLAIVDALADDWGTELAGPDGAGKTVWFTLRLPEASLEGN